jgi:hypothetical protein
VAEKVFDIFHFYFYSAEDAWSADVYGGKGGLENPLSRMFSGGKYVVTDMLKSFEERHEK